MGFLVCPNCKLPVSDEAASCPRCGFVFSGEPAVPPAPEAVPVPETVLPESPPSAKKKKNVPAIILGILLAISLGALIYMINQYNILYAENNSNLGVIRDNKARIGSLERDVDAKNQEIGDLRALDEDNTETIAELSEKADYHKELMKVLASEESWGYATENFHVDKGVMVLKRFGGMHELKLYSTYYTTFTFEVSDTSVCIAKWSDDEWINKDTTVFITPVSAGYATLTFTNELYDTSFKVLVVVE